MGRRAKIRVDVNDTVQTKAGEIGVVKKIVNLPRLDKLRPAADFAEVQLSDSLGVKSYDPRSLKTVTA